jgi:hypothetical protein
MAEGLGTDGVVLAGVRWEKPHHPENHEIATFETQDEVLEINDIKPTAPKEEL